MGLIGFVIKVVLFTSVYFCLLLTDTCIYRDLLVEESMNRYNKLTGETLNIA
jgi:hypothetical protein